MVPDHNACPGVVEIYEAVVALVNRIVRANGSGLLLCFEPCHVSSLVEGRGQVVMCLFIFLKDVGRLLLRLCLRLLSARRLKVPPLQAAGGERLTFPLLPSSLCLSPRSGEVGGGVAFCVCVFWTAVGGVCNCQEYQSQFESVTVRKAYLFSVLSLCPERIGMCNKLFQVIC